MPPVLPPKGAQACTKMPPEMRVIPSSDLRSLDVTSTKHRKNELGLAAKFGIWPLPNFHLKASKPSTFCRDLAVKSIQAATKDYRQANCEFRTHSID